MSKESKPRKPRSSTKKSTSELEAKIAELEAKLGHYSSQVKPADSMQDKLHLRHQNQDRQLQVLLMEHCQQEWPLRQNQKRSQNHMHHQYHLAKLHQHMQQPALQDIQEQILCNKSKTVISPPDKQYKGEPTVQASTSRPSPEPQYTYQETSSSQQKPKSSSSTWKAKVHRQQRNML